MREELLKYRTLAGFLKEALGERFEVTLTEADELKKSVMVKDRNLVETETVNEITDKLLEDILKSTELKKHDYFCSVSDAKNAVTGQKISVFYIKNEKGELIGFLGICEKENNRVTVREVVEQLLEPEGDEPPAVSDASRKIGEEVDKLLRERVEKIWKKYKIPGKKMRKAEKLDFMREIFETGIFRMKGAAIYISEITGISLASVYRYIGEVVEE